MENGGCKRGRHPRAGKRNFTRNTAGEKKKGEAVAVALMDALTYGNPIFNTALSEHVQFRNGPWDAAAF